MCRNSIYFLAIAVFFSCMVEPTVASGAPLTFGNLIASVNEFTGSITAPTYVAEYTTIGTRVQLLSEVPPPGSVIPGGTTDQARGLVHGPGNAIYLYNGTFGADLSRLDLGSLSWQRQTFSGWSTVNNGTYGGLGRYANYLYATDMTTFGGPNDILKGIVRFDTNGGPTVRFAETIEPIDLAIGPNGVIYALAGSVYKYDPLTFALLGVMPLDFGDNRAVTVASDGSFFIARWDGRIDHYSVSGGLIDSLLVGGTTFSDIAINTSGQIALGTGFSGELLLTDSSLDTFTRYRITDSVSGGDTFVSWVDSTSVPEPMSLPLLVVALIVLVSFRKAHR